jgi:hypothetical protein
MPGAAAALSCRAAQASSHSGFKLYQAAQPPLRPRQVRHSYNRTQSGPGRRLTKGSTARGRTRDSDSASEFGRLWPQPGPSRIWDPGPPGGGGPVRVRFTESARAGCHGDRYASGPLAGPERSSAA